MEENKNSVKQKHNKKPTNRVVSNQLMSGWKEEEKNWTNM